MVIMADGDNHPVARLQRLTNGRPQVSIECTGGHASEGLVLDGDLTPVEIFIGKETPTPLAIVTVAHRTIAHRGVANKKKYGVCALTGRARSRTVHQRFRNRVRRIVDDLLLRHRRRQVIKCLAHRHSGTHSQQKYRRQ